MVIRALDHVARCYSTEDGMALARVLRQALACHQNVTLSFAGVDDIPSSFVNSSIVALLDDFSPAALRARLKIVNASTQAADMIRRCLTNAARIPEAA